MTFGRANRRWTALRRGAGVFAAALALGLSLPAAARARKGPFAHRFVYVRE